MSVGENTQFQSLGMEEMTEREYKSTTPEYFHQLTSPSGPQFVRNVHVRQCLQQIDFLLDLRICVQCWGPITAKDVDRTLKSGFSVLKEISELMTTPSVAQARYGQPYGAPIFLSEPKIRFSKSYRSAFPVAVCGRRRTLRPMWRRILRKRRKLSRKKRASPRHRVPCLKGFKT
jgi:hypothetical protein